MLAKESTPLGQVDLLQPGDHAVQFYFDSRSLCASVGRFLADGFASDQPGIIIATPERCAAILDTLSAQGFRTHELMRNDLLHLIDARETLAAFMSGDMPDPIRFKHHVGSLIVDAKQRRSTDVVRAYGEMVDVLWKSGQPKAAIRLEILWNHLATHQSFSLLCGYAIGSFYEQTAHAPGLGFEDVCREHTHVDILPGAPAPAEPQASATPAPTF